MNDCAILTFAMASVMMALCTLVFCKMGKKSCAEGALLSLVGIGVGVVALLCIFPGFQCMIHNLPVVNTMINGNGLLVLLIDCIVLAATATLATMALCSPLKMKQCKPQDLYKCFFVGLVLAAAVGYFINSGCMIKHSHNTEKVEKKNQ